MCSETLKTEARLWNIWQYLSKSSNVCLLPSLDLWALNLAQISHDMNRVGAQPSLVYARNIILAKQCCTAAGWRFATCVGQHGPGRSSWESPRRNRMLLSSLASKSPSAMAPSSEPLLKERHRIVFFFYQPWRSALIIKAILKGSSERHHCRPTLKLEHWSKPDSPTPPTVLDCFRRVTALPGLRLWAASAGPSGEQKKQVLVVWESAPLPPQPLGLCSWTASAVGLRTDVPGRWPSSLPSNTRGAGPCTLAAYRPVSLAEPCPLLH